jgi:hypothetical protein
MTPASVTLREAAGEEMARRQKAAQRREQEQRIGAAQQASGQIAGRLMGGMPIPTAPGPMAGDELTGVNVQSAYRRDPQDALRMAMTPAGVDAMQINPFLQPALQEAMKPPAAPKYEYKTVDNLLVAVNPTDPSDVRVVQRAPRPEAKPAGGDETYEGLRKEWSGMTKDYRSIADMWAKIREAATNPTPANDIALIFGYMKILDPGSVVREGEFATAQNASSIDETVRARYNQLIKNKGLLSDEQRQYFVQSAYGTVKSQVPIVESLKQDYESIARAGGLDARRSIIDPFKSVLLPLITDDAEGKKKFDDLPDGALFEAPDGSIQRKRKSQ